MTAEERIVETLRRFSEVRKVYLFGSRARGDAGPRADIDIAVSCPDADEAEWLRIWDEIEQTETLLFIDLVRFEEAPEAQRSRILREGKVIYERSQA